MHLKRISLGLAAIILSTSTVLASSVSVPLGCQNGTRSEPQPDIPGYVIQHPDIVTSKFVKYLDGGVGRDNSISKYCRAEFAGSAYQRDGGWCDQLASTASLVPAKKSKKVITPVPDTIVDPVPQPDLIIPTKTVKIKTVTVSPTRPFVTVTHSYETSDGTCR
jgi:hypothetical protein